MHISVFKKKKYSCTKASLSNFRSSRRKKNAFDLHQSNPLDLGTTKVVVPKVNTAAETHNLQKSFPSHHPAVSINGFPESSGHKEGNAFMVGY